MNLNDCNRLLRQGKPLDALEGYIRLNRIQNYAKLMPLLNYNISLAIERIINTPGKTTADQVIERLKERSLALLDPKSTRPKSTLSKNKLLRSRIEKATVEEIKGWVLLENRATHPSLHFRVDLTIAGAAHS